MKATLIILWPVPAGYAPGDYAKLFGNNGSGDIDFDSPVTNDIFELFPHNSGLYGFGHGPFGYTRFGKAHAMGTLGFGHGPFGHGPFGHGFTLITANHQVKECGAYKYAFGVFDSKGNLSAESPEQVTLTAHMPPDPPTGLKKVSFTKATGLLILEAA